jgi:hypothetical protein
MQILTIELIATVLFLFLNKWRNPLQKKRKQLGDQKTTKTQRIKQVDQIW